MTYFHPLVNHPECVDVTINDALVWGLSLERFTGVPRDVAKDWKTSSLLRIKRSKEWDILVKRMLIRRSQEQPVMKPTAAGGKRMATCGGDKSLVERDRKELTRMRRTSDPRTMVGYMRGICGEYMRGLWKSSRGGVQGEHAVTSRRCKQR